MTEMSLEAFDKSLSSHQVDSRFWIVPPELYRSLDQEFHFDFDPCPYPYVKDGIDLEWGKMNWVNPPFKRKDAISGHGLTSFVRKAIDEKKKGNASVLILPLHSYQQYLIEAGAEIRALGRIKWIDARNHKRMSSPNNCALFILRSKK